MNTAEWMIATGLNKRIVKLEADKREACAERCFECGELIEPGTEIDNGGHCYHPGCDPDFNGVICTDCGQPSPAGLFYAGNRQLCGPCAEKYM